MYIFDEACVLSAGRREMSSTSSSSNTFFKNGFFCVRCKSSNKQAVTVMTESFINAMRLYLSAKEDRVTLIYFPGDGRGKIRHMRRR